MSVEKKKRMRNNQRVISNIKSKTSDSGKFSGNAVPTLSSLENEIDQIADNLLKLKGREKTDYLNDLQSRSDSLEIARGLVITFGKLLDSYIGFNKEIVTIYYKEIQLLHKRLDKINENDNPVEINYIFKQLEDITNKIQSVQKGQQNILGAIGVGLVAALSLIVHSKFKKT